MEKTCRVVKRNDNDNDDYLEHKFKPKYLKKVKGDNGKWRYIYTEKTKNNGNKVWTKTLGEEDNKYDKKKDGRYGLYKNGNEQYRYTISNEIFSKEASAWIKDEKGNDVFFTIYREGMLERGVEAVGDVLSKTKKKSIKSLKKASDKGRKMIEKLLKKR